MNKNKEIETSEGYWIRDYMYQYNKMVKNMEKMLEDYDEQ